jgi:hypothetical protein
MTLTFFLKRLNILTTLIQAQGKPKIEQENYTPLHGKRVKIDPPTNYQTPRSKEQEPQQTPTNNLKLPCESVNRSNHIS